MNFARQLRTITRFGLLARYIDAHLDDEIDLHTLAEVAHLSHRRLDTAFSDYADETPMGRVWRLRLLRARHRIVAHPQRPLLDVALEAGYGSAAAFTRAFRRLHGIPPSACRDRQPAGKAPLRIEQLPPLPIQYVPYRGSRDELSDAANELRARVMIRGIDRQRRYGWQVDARALLLDKAASPSINLEAGLLHDPLGERVPGLDRGSIPGGHYAVFSFRGRDPVPSESVLLARILHETGWQPDAGPWLRRCRNKTFLPSLLESRFEVYIPVRAPMRGEPVPATPFVLAR